MQSKGPQMNALQVRAQKAQPFDVVLFEGEELMSGCENSEGSLETQ